MSNVVDALQDWSSVFFPHRPQYEHEYTCQMVVQRISGDSLRLPSLFRRSSKGGEGGVRDVVQQALHLIHS